MTATPDLVPARRGRAVVTHPVTAVVVGGVFFGTAGVAQAYAPQGASPLSVGAVRLTVGAVAITAYLMATGWSPRRLVPLWRAKATVVAALGAAAYQPFFFAGIGYAGVPLGTLVAVGSAPLFTGLLSWALLRERPTRAWLTATSIALVGLATLTGVGVGDSRALLGIVLTAGAGLSIATFTVAAKRLLGRGVSVLEVLASTFLIGGVVMLPLALASGLGWVRSGSGVGIALYLGLVTMGLANILYTRGLSALPAASAATLTLADPLTATLLGAVLLGQLLGPFGWLGLAILFAGLVLQGVWAVRPLDSAS